MGCPLERDAFNIEAKVPGCTGISLEQRKKKKNVERNKRNATAALSKPGRRTHLEKQME